MYMKMSFENSSLMPLWRKSHQLLAKKKRVLNLTGMDSRDFGDSSNDSSHISTIWWEKGETRTSQMEFLGGRLNKKALHTIMFTSEMQNLAYIMIFNLYMVRNLTNLSALRTIFLYGFFTHKEIDICSHIYHIFTKSITKRNSRLTLPFPSLVMSLILRAKVKIPSGLQVMQWKDPISAKPWSEAKSIFSDHQLVSLKFQEMLLNKEVTLKRKLSTTLQFRRTLHNLLPMCMQEHLVALII